MSVVSAREFHRSPSAAKRMAREGPVFVTDRGRLSLVVLDIAEYERLTGAQSLRDALRMDEEIDVEPVVSRDVPGAADL
ncbi:type II toxin-antitoxin system Phd/YefM family antitoxin [Nocardioides sp. TRM66260-LWL]|uniref:type II toxin-antitoxin system Phd/YefM family antitoxin n=1 Tax=Nocardioides sp. TRM66260-LWL TaxID=2874478 RepID=UPI001CC49BFA|nr:type II toxin-antitoxin system Phd/YefM family antitoxin [Nocardioides sp. TRM66260-LWL]MBZ5734920.1 type II toxin-antitoxin system Phd/YefM family antitoxin [Nocardioides sp. TRM66260-LWL]